MPPVTNAEKDTPTSALVLAIAMSGSTPTGLKGLEHPSKQQQHLRKQFFVQEIAASEAFKFGQRFGIKGVLATTSLLSEKAKKAA